MDWIAACFTILKHNHKQIEIFGWLCLFLPHRSIIKSLPQHPEFLFLVDAVLLPITTSVYFREPHYSIAFSFRCVWVKTCCWKVPNYDSKEKNLHMLWYTVVGAWGSWMICRRKYGHKAVRSLIEKIYQKFHKVKRKI